MTGKQARNAVVNEPDIQKTASVKAAINVEIQIKDQLSLESLIKKINIKLLEHSKSRLCC